MHGLFKDLKDEELVRLVQTGDHKYFGGLVARYEKHILQKCKSYVKNKDDAEELTQEILIKLFLQISSFRQEAKFTTWMYTVIYHTCIDFLRKSKKTMHQVITEKLVDEVSDIADFDESPNQEMSVEILDLLLDELLPEDKMILLLKYKEKHPIKDIQQTLGISESAIKMRLSRAKERLNKLYQQRVNR